MTFNSINEIYEALEASHARFAATLAGLDEGAADFRTAPERWSIAEVAEHVAIVESQVARLVSMLVERAPSLDAHGGDGGDNSEGSGRAFAPVSVAEIAERAAREKFQAPETALPRGGASVADSLARVERAHASLRELRTRVEGADGAAVTYPHPVFGTLNLYQWLVMVGLHKERHARQITQLRESYADQRATTRT